MTQYDALRDIITIHSVASLLVFIFVAYREIHCTRAIEIPGSRFSHRPSIPILQADGFTGICATSSVTSSASSREAPKRLARAVVATHADDGENMTR